MPPPSSHLSSSKRRQMVSYYTLQTKFATILELPCPSVCLYTFFSKVHLWNYFIFFKLCIIIINHLNLYIVLKLKNFKDLKVAFTRGLSWPCTKVISTRSRSKVLNTNKCCLRYSFEKVDTWDGFQKFRTLNNKWTRVCHDHMS